MKRVLVVGHADADGHLIAEQVRRNVASIRGFDVSVVIDPVRTAGHKAWTRLDQFPEIEASELILFVDLMFAPPSFVAEADALVRFALAHPRKQFFVLDHHPLPLRRLYLAPNIRPVYRPDVFDCTFGTSSWLMGLAAMLETQPTRVQPRTTEDRVVAQGIRRAAAAGGPLAGPKLLALIQHDRWSELMQLGADDASFHRLPRGRRPAHYPQSTLMDHMNALATELMHSAPPVYAHPHERSAAMSYDLDTVPYGTVPLPDIPTSDRSDLEAIVTLLELAAICLTPYPGAPFTKQQLIAKAREMGGDDIQLEEADIKIVLGKPGFLKKSTEGPGLICMK